MTTKREEWTANDVGEVFDEIGAMVANARPEHARRIAAVPDYERALMALATYGRAESRDGIPCWCARRYLAAIEPHDWWCVDARAALRKGGVLP
jgi:hypothetical protein